MGLFSRTQSHSVENRDIYAGPGKGSGACSKFLNIVGILASLTMMCVGFSIIFSFGVAEDEGGPEEVTFLQQFMNLVLALVYLGSGAFGVLLELKRFSFVDTWLKMLTTFKGRALWYLVFGLLSMNPNPAEEMDEEDEKTFSFTILSLGMLFTSSFLFFVSSFVLEECSVLLD